MWKTKAAFMYFYLLESTNENTTDKRKKPVTSIPLKFFRLLLYPWKISSALFHQKDLIPSHFHFPGKNLCRLLLIFPALHWLPLYHYIWIERLYDLVA